RTDYQGDKAITTVVASGTTSSDGDGLGTVRATYRGPDASLTLRIKGKDASGNVFEDARDVTIGWLVTQLDVATDKIAYKVGDSAHLTVTSPAAFNVLLSLERGRVHQYKWISLAKGSNALTVDVTPDLAPGFTAAFSYIRDGRYSSEVFPVSVNNCSRLPDTEPSGHQRIELTVGDRHLRRRLRSRGQPASGRCHLRRAHHDLGDQPGYGRDGARDHQRPDHSIGRHPGGRARRHRGVGLGAGGD